ncbi:hypothetical protein B005_1779 [Nocardiopsis alba ATCC BAA-2165]|uniref:Uncharacterized protein n=1 Tax=Nocardiopsis alba (strain ATCC BAA-2165 / BE74) TaxID=1205910 RepID=J7L6F1_NOCAA|nr:hypothetical protein B005_1779 [Nocardiopsis alba ATCC BAA-2165]
MGGLRSLRGRTGNILLYSRGRTDHSALSRASGTGLASDDPYGRFFADTARKRYPSSLSAP